MNSSEILQDAFARVVENAKNVLDGLNEDQLATRVGPAANSIAWLIWHLTRVQDDHVSEVAGVRQVWVAQDFVHRFGLPFPTADTGYGHTSEQVAQVRVSGDLLAEYLQATHEQTIAFLKTLSEDDLNRVVDERWDPAVTLGVRLVSVVNDDTQHVGQAAYVRGLLSA